MGGFQAPMEWSEEWGGPMVGAPLICMRFSCRAIGESRIRLASKGQHVYYPRLREFSTRWNGQEDSLRTMPGRGCFEESFVQKGQESFSSPVVVQVSFLASKAARTSGNRVSKAVCNFSRRFSAASAFSLQRRLSLASSPALRLHR